MTKGDLQKMATQFNSKASGMSASNKSNVSSSVNDLVQQWDTTNGAATVLKMISQARALENSLDEMERIVNSIKATTVTVSFTERRTEEVV